MAFDYSRLRAEIHGSDVEIMTHVTRSETAAASNVATYCETKKKETRGLVETLLY